MSSPHKVRPFANAAVAELAGFTVDRHCYPWVAYKGPRFNPTEWHYLDTDDEALLRGVAGSAMDVIHTLTVILVDHGKVELGTPQSKYLGEVVARMKGALGREPQVVDHFPGVRS